ncbi:MAG: asparagine synthase (glutamine-hydrolyzing) [Deltaproteobacteria bacterium]|nr:asparagine synthase (glutamine-hydrolyzing) [Deltaproteobacteria bacterium]
MCGICGVLDFSNQGVSQALLQRMTQSFSYRGPDDEGFFVNPPIGLGHRRLSIIDLSSSGRQPMSNEDDSIWLIFNGEIYGFETLRKSLKEKGHVLKSRTDSETIIHLYEEERVQCLHNLNGMFAFAIWDNKLQQLWLVRDRLGLKPLHYYWNGHRFVFASEIKAILCDPTVPKDIDWDALDLYLTLNYIPAPWTIFKNIKKLAPGHYLTLNNGTLSIKPYWDIPIDSAQWELSDPDISNDQKNRLYKLVENAVRRRLISDVPLGAFLSGGIDSSIIVGLMARNSEQPVKTFSIGYQDLPSFDETHYAREVAAFNHTDHHEFKLGYKDILDVFPKVLENVDEPFADSSAIPTYIVSQETKNHVTVALSGDGGDELFAGYRMYQGEYWAHYYSKIPSFLRDGLVAPIINLLPDTRDNPSLEKIRRIKKFIKGMSNSFAERYYGWREIFSYSLRKDLLSAPLRKNLFLDHVQEIVGKERNRFAGDIINMMLYMDVKGLLPNDMLTKVDRMSMANSLEVRVPFLDYSVVEYVFQLRGDTKLRGRTGKYILIETFKHLLPPSLYDRPKWGFEMPIGAWLKKELRFLVDEYLDKATIQKQGIFRYDVITDLVDKHMTGRQDTSWHLWNLIVFQHWYKRYF